MDLKQVIREVPDFPKPGILFRDITPVLLDPHAFRAALAGLRALLEPSNFDKIAAIESRGFLFAAPLAAELGRGLVIVRKPGKLPADTIAEAYQLEYGEASLQMHVDALMPGERVIIMDDLLATGGTAAAAARLVTRAGAVVVGWCFLVELAELGGRSKLHGAPVFSLVNC